jgi:TatD DNase family protein
VRLTPIDRLVVATASPYLTPEPMRKQKVNEPSQVVHVAATVAREKGVSVAELDRITTENAEKFFGWDR